MMLNNKIDAFIAKGLKGRALKPSDSAWERLNSQLEVAARQKKKKRLLYFGYAASFLLLLSVGYVNYIQPNPIKNSVIIVDAPKDSITFDTVIFEETLPEIKEAIVEVPKVKKKSSKKNIFKKDKKESNNIAQHQQKNIETIKKDVEIDENISKKTQNPIEVLQNKSLKTRSKITVSSNDLLFAVTHSPEEINAYYAKHQIERKEVLKTIESALKKSNIKIKPTIILAEIERTIEDEEFKGDFMQQLKVKISDIALAFADRNK